MYYLSSTLLYQYIIYWIQEKCSFVKELPVGLRISLSHHTYMHKTILPYNRKLKPFSQINRKSMTKAESLVWHCILKNDKTGYRRLRQKPVGHYILDFYCHQLKLCIEIDWWYHNHIQEADQLREDTLLYKYVIRTIRYTNAQVESHLQGVTDDINSVIVWYANGIRT